jgi:hypothetical protein
MFAVLVISFALMFALVKFTENVIATPEFTGEGEIAGANDTNKAP